MKTIQEQQSEEVQIAINEIILD